MTAQSPYLFIITGTSGSGRKTAAHKALKNSNVVHVPSCTDRPPRSIAPPDNDYRYVNSEQFEIMRNNNLFVEYVQIDRHRYGISRRYLDLALGAGNHAYVILNRNGSDALRAEYGERAIRIFIYVNKTTVRERLEAKGMAYDVVDNYLENYNEEVTYRKSCEHVIENISLESTITQIRTIVNHYISQL
jgi:guanylate kinase